MNEEDSAPLNPAELAAIDPTGGLDDLLIFGSPATRRHFLKQVAGTGAALSLGPTLLGVSSAEAADTSAAPSPIATAVTKFALKINGQEHTLEVDPRTTLLDALREHLK